MPFSTPHHALTLLSAPALRTIIKAQGQTLERVGVYLQKPCFTHGQLYMYVAASRVGKKEHIRFAVDKNEAGEFRTANFVFHEALTAAADASAPLEPPQEYVYDDGADAFSPRPTTRPDLGIDHEFT